MIVILILCLKKCKKTMTVSKTVDYEMKEGEKDGGDCGYTFANSAYEPN